MNVNKVLTKDYENKWQRTLGQNEPNTNPKRTQYEPNQTRSEAEIPTGEILGILKPGTNFKGKKMLKLILYGIKTFLSLAEKFL